MRISVATAAYLKLILFSRRIIGTVAKKLRYLRCARIGLWQGATQNRLAFQRSVTEKQRRQRSILAQPSGWPAFLPLRSFLAPYRPLKGMLVPRASAAP